jgi:hypothetical protein
MASSKVDFPDPFSPTKSVTGTSTSSTGNDRTAGTSNGNEAASARVGAPF